MSKPEVIGGKLKLKGGPIFSAGISGKKRSYEETGVVKSSNDESNQVTSKILSEEISSSSISKDSNENIKKKAHMDGLTQAQRRFREKKALALKSRDLKKLASQTYRERLENFNMKLATTTEHNDIPRISAAGNG